MIDFLVDNGEKFSYPISTYTELVTTARQIERRTKCAVSAMVGDVCLGIYYTDSNIFYPTKEVYKYIRRF